MIRQNNFEIVEEFIDVIYNQVKSKYSEEAGIKNVLNHLAEKGLIEPRKIRDYMIIQDFDKILKSNENNYTFTYMDISIKYDVSERTIQNIIYKHKRKFNKGYTKTI